MPKAIMLAICVFCAVTLESRSAFSRHRITLSPTLTLSTSYTDNVFLEDEDQESSWITVVSPGVTLQAEGKTSGATLSYAPGFPSFENDEADSISIVRHNASFHGYKQVTKRLNLQISDTFTRTDDPFSVNATRVGPGPNIEFLDRAGREPYYTNNINVGLVYQADKHDNLSLNYTNQIRRQREPHDVHSFSSAFTHVFGRRDVWGLYYDFREFNSRNAESEDSQSQNPAFDLSYWFTDHFGMDAGVSYTRGDFSGETSSHHDLAGNLRLIRNFTKHLDGYLRYNHTSFNAEDGDEDDYQVYDPGLGVYYAWSEDTFLDLSVGYFYQDNEIGDDQSGISVSGSAVKKWDFKRGAISATGGAGYDQDYFGAENLGFTIYRFVALNGFYNFTKRFNGSVSAGYRRDSYVNQDPERIDETYDLGCGLTYIVRPWLHVRLSEHYRFLDSDDEDQNFDENRVTLSISFLPRPWELNDQLR